MKRVLIIAQEINQAYIDQLVKALGDNAVLDVISGANITGSQVRLIKSPKHDPRSLKSRAVCWMRHLIFIKKWSRKNDTNYDLIYAVSNPPINSYIGLKLKKKFNTPFIYMNWDIYPQIIETSIKSFFVKIPCIFWRRWNTKNYPKIDKMITIGPKMAKAITKATGKKINLSIIPLGVNTDIIKPIRKENNVFIKNNNLEGKFIVLFSGKMGVGHNIELILRAASRLKNEPEIAFVFIGGGPKYQLIENYINRKNTENIWLYPWQNDDMYPNSIACGDIAIVTEEKSAEGLMLPSRVFSMMASGEAVIGVCGKRDDLYNIIETNHIGKCVIDDDVTKLVRSILSLYHDKKELLLMQRRARKVAVKQFSRNNSIRLYRDLFNGI